MNKAELVEQLSDKEHASWARWMDYLFSRCPFSVKGDAIIPRELVARWKKQIETPYSELSEREKQSDRDEVAHILPLIDAYMEHATVAINNAQMAQGMRLHPNAMMRTIEADV